MSLVSPKAGSYPVKDIRRSSVGASGEKLGLHPCPKKTPQNLPPENGPPAISQ